MFCGFLIVWAEYQTPVLPFVARLPLALYFWERYARGCGRRYALSMLRSCGDVVARRHLQYAVYVLLAFYAYAPGAAGLTGARPLVAAFAAGGHCARAGRSPDLASLELGFYNHRAGGQR